MVTVGKHHNHQQPPPSSGPKLESLTHIDMSKLSQSELQSLSKCSSAAFDLRRTDNLVIPSVDRSVFNQSAGSRRQTFSRPRGRRRRLSPTPPNDPHLADNKNIVNCLKQLIGESQNSNSQIVCYDQAHANVEETQGLGIEGKKRKRVRKSKGNVEEIGDEIEFGVVNGKGVAVDLAGLENADDLYCTELSKWTVGLETEEDCLGFLRGLEGQWCSRRKKRRIIDAGMFGHALPAGWKLILALKRRGGRVSAYCRRYMSPSGQQFPSCKDAASYLRSHYNRNDANPLMDQSIQHVDHVASESDIQQHAGSIHKADEVKHAAISNTALPISSISDAHDKEVSLLGIDNLPEVQVKDLFECYSCKMAFDEKDAYMQHLLLFHEKTTRRFNFRKPAGEGAITNDAKFECESCHKVFQERRRYTRHIKIHMKSHVQSPRNMAGQVTVEKNSESQTQDAVPSRTSKSAGEGAIINNGMFECKSCHKVFMERRRYSRHIKIHMKSQVQSSKKSPAQVAVEKNIESETQDLESLQTSKMDALIQIVQNSFVETASGSHDDKVNGVSSLNQLNKEEISAASVGLKLRTDSVADKALNQELNQHHDNSAVRDGSSPKIVSVLKNGNSKSVVSTNFKHPKLDKVGKIGNDELGNDCRISHDKPSHDVVVVPKAQHIEENVLQKRFAGQSLPSFPSMPKRENESCYAHQKIDSVKGLETRLGDIVPVNGQGFPTLPEVSKDRANKATTKACRNTFVGLESESVMLDKAIRHQFTTVCVWCCKEFCHEAIDLENESDSIGFMCPTCKAKISGQLDSGLSMNSRRF